MTDLLHSRKFLLLAMDAVISILIYFVGKYASVAIDDVRFLIGVLQPVMLMVIYTVGKEDVARIDADMRIHMAEIAREESQMWRDEDKASE